MMSDLDAQLAEVLFGWKPREPGKALEMSDE